MVNLNSNDKHFLEEYFGWFNPRLYYLSLNEHIRCLVILDRIFEYKCHYYYRLNELGYAYLYNELNICLDFVISRLMKVRRFNPARYRKQSKIKYLKEKKLG